MLEFLNLFLCCLNIRIVMQMIETLIWNLNFLDFLVIERGKNRNERKYDRTYHFYISTKVFLWIFSILFSIVFVTLTWKCLVWQVPYILETFSFFVCLFVCFFKGLYPWHMEVPRLGVELELQLLAYATATATPDLSCVCDLYHRSRECRILNLLSEARDQTCNLMVPNWICFHCAMMGTPKTFSFLLQ